MSQIHAVGRRKTAVARVYLKTGTGSVKINKRDSDVYLNTDVLRMKIRKPFEILSLSIDNFDLVINVFGGGPNGQADAIRLGIARALEKYAPENRTQLKKVGLLKVDDRQVERKKPGLRKARRSTQFSKR